MNNDEFEIDHEGDESNSSYEDFMDDILKGDMVSAENRFSDIMADRVSTALDQRKVDIAQSMYNDSFENDEEESVEDENSSEE